MYFDSMSPVYLPFMINKENKFDFVCLVCAVEFGKVTVCHFAYQLLIPHILKDIITDTLARGMTKINVIQQISEHDTNPFYPFVICGSYFSTPCTIVTYFLIKCFGFVGA